MRSLTVSKDIVSLSDFKKRASRMIHEVRTSNRPLVITQNGKAAAVLISPGEFDRLSEAEGCLNFPGTTFASASWETTASFTRSSRIASLF